jgi:hypothetical protein
MAAGEIDDVRLVAEALGAELVTANRMVEFRWPAQSCNSLVAPDTRGMWPALVSLVRRLREAERERHALKARVAELEGRETGPSSWCAAIAAL